MLRPGSSAGKGARGEAPPLPPGGLSCQPGDLLAERFRIVRFLAQGGMGEVYEAEDIELGGHLAVKTIRPELAADDRSLLRFKREIQLARKVTHPNVSRVYDLFHHYPGGHPGAGSRSGAAAGPIGERPLLFLTMELLEGETLAARIARDGPLAPERALPLARQLADGLDAAHRAGVIHRDFNCKNVMLVPDEERGAGRLRAVITDFGLAHAARGSEVGLTVTGSGMIVGTPAYLAPEQVTGEEVTPSVDLYAFGIVLFEVVTGRLPFVGDGPLPTATMRLSQPAPSPRRHTPDLPPAWENAILTAMERQPEDRFASAGEAVALLEGQPVRTRRRRRRQRAPARRLAGGPWIWGAALLAALLVGALLALVLRPRDPPEPGAASGAATRSAVAILGFRNLTGEAESAWLAPALAEMVATELAAGGSLRVLPGENVARARLELGLAQPEPPVGDTLERLRRNLGADYLVSGSFGALPAPAGGDGGSLRVDVRLLAATAGETVSTFSSEGSRGELFELVRRVGEQLRAALGVGDLSADDRRAVAASMPASPEAARLYAEGLERLRFFDALGAAELLQRAVAAESEFPLSHAALAAAYKSLDREAQAAAAAERAFELSGDLPRAERLLVEARYLEATDRWQEAMEIHRSLWLLFPDNLEHGIRLARAEIAAGDPPRALATVDQLRRLSSDDPRIDLVQAEAARAVADYSLLGRSARAAKAAAEASGARLLWARARYLEGIALRQRGDTAAARTAFEESQSTHAALGDKGGEAQVLNSMAILEGNQGQPQEARRLYEESLSISREIGHEGGAARALNNLAMLARSRGDVDGAREMYEEALAVFRRVGKHSGEARALNNLGILLGNQGQRRQARQHLEAALALHRQLGDQAGVAGTLNNLGNLLLTDGELAEAAELHREAEELARSFDGRAELAYALAGQAMVRLFSGEPSAAETAYGEAEELARQLGWTSLTAWMLAGRGELELARGRLGEARGLLEESLRLRQEIGEVRGAAESRLFLARLELAGGRPQAAAELALAAAEEYRQEGSAGPRCTALAAAARALLAAGDLAAARDRVAEAESELPDSGGGLWDQLFVARAAAEVAVADGRRQQGLERLRQARRQAEEAGGTLRVMELTISLAAAGDEAARAELPALVAEAEERGLDGIAAAASALLSGALL